jgi:hypothetical protein
VDHHYYHLILMIHPEHQNRYNQQLKEIFEIPKQMMFLVNVCFVDMYIVMILFGYLDHDIDK